MPPLTRNTTLDVRTRLATFACTACLILLASPPHASAQLVPERSANGINRPIPARVVVPEEHTGVVQIRLYEPGSAGTGSAGVVDAAPVEPGPINLAGVFDTLWTTTDPKVYYAQLFVDDKAIGPALALIPMLTPSYASQVDRLNRPQYQPGDPVYSGIRVVVDRDLVLTTTEGQMRFRLRIDQAPNTVLNIRRLVEEGFYDGITFHRVIPTTADGRPFIVQTGDPTGQGTGGPGYQIDAEPSGLEHDFGVLSMARAPTTPGTDNDDPNTAGSQFFICLSREGTAGLDGKYTAFAEMLEGDDTLLRIARTPLEPGTDRPADPPVILDAEITDAKPYGTEKPIEDPRTTTPER